MKSLKKLLIVLLFSLSTILSAQTLMQNLNGFTKTKVATGTVPEGKTLLPAVYEYVKGFNVAEGNVGACDFLAFDVTNDFYRIKQSIIYKAGLGFSNQTTLFEVSLDGNVFTVNTTEMTNTTVDKKGKAIGPVRDAANSSLTKSNKITVECLEKIFSSDDETWKKLNEKAYSDIDVIICFANNAANKIKAKKFFNDHPVEGKNIEFKFVFYEIDESNVEGYAYKLSGLYTCRFTKEVSPVAIYFYSNDDSLAEKNNGSVIEVKGKIDSINFDETLGLKVSRITVKE